MSDTIVFDSPASQWEEALPLGNGRLGAVIFGSPDRERIQLNEDSIWSGSRRGDGRDNPAARTELPIIRRLLSEGRVREAEERAIECFSGIPQTQRVYQSAGELQISFSPAGIFGHPWSGTRAGPLLTGIRDYRRELDMSRALHTLSFNYDDLVFTRECIISAPADLLILRFTAADSAGKPVPAALSLRAGLDRGVFFDRKGNSGDAAFITRDGDIPFCAMIKIVQTGGTQRSQGGFITVEKANEVLLFADIRTGFREKDPAAACIAHINHAAAQNWPQLLREHHDEHRSWYSRLKLELPLQTQTAVRYFNFCRYALIACSRPGSLPANLQGVWNPHMDPPWGSDYTININTQMNYWPACMCNLAETEMPLFDLLERMYPNGKKTAEIMYGCRGFTAHHNTDIWGDTAPRDYWLPASYWLLGAAWLSLHIWEHYEYTQDRHFLKDYFYLLKESCVFFTDFLIPGNSANEQGEPYLVVSPSVSPENSYLLNDGAGSLCAGCAMDNQILRTLFGATIRAADIMGIDGEDIAQFRSILGRIPAQAIMHHNGSIREWHDEYEEAEPGHRHFSHLFDLWPGNAITVDETPEIAAAARKSLDLRMAASGGHTGWSRAWLVNFMARLHDSEAALENLNALFNQFTLPNLFNNGPPFQIDGNFGALAGMTQMLAQSRVRYRADGIQVQIDLLPALPSCWPVGSLKGVCVKGNLELDFSWQDGNKITSLVIRNKGDRIPILLRAPEFASVDCILEPGETVIR